MALSLDKKCFSDLGAMSFFWQILDLKELATYRTSFVLLRQELFYDHPIKIY